METQERCRLLAEKIRSIFQKGLTLTSDAVHYIDSTFATPSLEELKDIITDESNSEKDSFFELIFFPDASIQCQLESLLENGGFQKADEKRVLDYLVKDLPATQLCFPDNRGTLPVKMPEPVADQFISRLNILKKMDTRLSEAICKHVSNGRKTRVKVKLRNSRSNKTEKRIFFLCTFFEKMKDNDDQCLDFLLDFFDEQQDDGDIYQLLMDKKRFFFQNLQKAKRHQNLLGKYNMETLMMRGVRIPHIDTADVENKMGIIDRICQTVYGKTEYFQQPHEVMGDISISSGK